MTNLSIGETTTINQEINEISGSGDTYEIRYSFSSGGGNLKRFSGSTIETMSPGVSYDVSASSFFWEFEATITGETIIDFVAKNNSGIEKNISIRINVLENSYSFNAISTSNSAIVSNLVPINFNINEIVGTSNYTMVFTSAMEAAKVEVLALLKKSVVQTRKLCFPYLW